MGLVRPRALAVLRLITISYLARPPRRRAAEKHYEIAPLSNLSSQTSKRRHARWAGNSLL